MLGLGKEENRFKIDLNVAQHIFSQLAESSSKVMIITDGAETYTLGQLFIQHFELRYHPIEQKIQEKITEVHANGNSKMAVLRDVLGRELGSNEMALTAGFVSLEESFRKLYALRDKLLQQPGNVQKIQAEMKLLRENIVTDLAQRLGQCLAISTWGLASPFAVYFMSQDGRYERQLIVGDKQQRGWEAGALEFFAQKLKKLGFDTTPIYKRFCNRGGLVTAFTRDIKIAVKHDDLLKVGNIRNPTRVKDYQKVLFDVGSYFKK